MGDSNTPWGFNHHFFRLFKEATCADTMKHLNSWQFLKKASDFHQKLLVSTIIAKLTFFNILKD